MILYVDGISSGIQCTNVSYWIEDHESAFELLTQLVTDDWTLQNATIVDGNDRMAVPVEVFDGQPVQVHIRSLERQWQQILSNQPVLSTALSEEQLKEWHIQLDAYYEDMLTHLEKMISILEMRKAKLTTRPDEPLKFRLREQYNSLLEINRRMYRETKRNHQKNCLQLNRFDKGKPSS